LSTATDSLSTVSSGAEASLSTATSTLSTATSSALDQNQLYSDQNQVFGAAAGYEALSAFALIGGGGVFVQGGNNADNTAYAVANSDGSQVGVFGIEYTGSTLYGYSPDPDFVQSTIINATLTGNVGGTTAWTLLGGLGQDSIVGGNNDGEYIVGDLETLVGANQGRIFAANSDTIVGNDGTSTIWGDFVLGLDANGDIDTANVDGITIGADDSIVGGANGDTIFGGGGNDDILAGDGTNLVYGQGGNDSIVSGAGNDDIYGGIGNDSIVGSLGDDSLFGGDGNDDFQFGNGDLTTSATIYGGSSDANGVGIGSGQDTISFVEDNTVVDDSVFEFVSNIDVLTTANGDGAGLDGSSLSLDGFASDAGVSTVQGGNGDDTFTLGSNFDTAVTLLGGAGNDDFVVDNYGQVTLGYIDGEAGTADTLTFQNSLGTSVIDMAGIQSTNVSNIEEIQLGNTASNYVNLVGTAGWSIPTITGGADVQNFITTFNLNASVTLVGGNLSDDITAGNFADRLLGYIGA
jgi:hypothetical protein